MAETVDSIASLVRWIADDQEIQFLDTAVQLAAINSGYREFQRRLTNAGSGLMRQTAVLTVPANTTVINADTIPPFPDDFIMPYVLRERPFGATAMDYCPMEEKDWPVGTVPVPFLRQWAWQGGSINFIGATQALSVQMEYARKYPVLIAPDGVYGTLPQPFWGGIDAIAWCVLYMVAMQRGSSEAYRAECSKMADRMLDETMSMHVKRDQLQRRHRPAHLRWIF